MADLAINGQLPKMLGPVQLHLNVYLLNRSPFSLRFDFMDMFCSFFTGFVVFAGTRISSSYGPAILMLLCTLLRDALS